MKLDSWMTEFYGSPWYRLDSTDNPKLCKEEGLYELRLSSDDFSGTYSIVWRATNTPYTASWLQVRGSDDSLLTRNIIADGDITADNGVFTEKVGIGQTNLSADVGLYVKKAAGTVIKSETTGTNGNPDVLIVDAESRSQRPLQ